MLQLAVRHRLAVQLVMMALQLSRGCLTAIAQVAVLARRLARQPPCVTFQQPCLCNFYRSYSVPILVNLQLVTAPNGSTVSEEAFIAQLLLELLSAAGHNNTLIWGKSDTVVEHVKQSVPAQLAGYTVMMDHTGSAPHFEDPLRTRMKHVEVSQVFAASSCTATWLCCVACCPVPWCLLEHMLLHSMQPLQGLPSGTSHLGMPLPLGVNA
eukprot:GHUV01037294.1.p1 GENE.GHUV01037294.1~~GHUV01037294.1.p1  ORF type:complete len:210 (+),score=21.00 GHUV01037294.1:1249-1878(+)